MDNRDREHLLALKVMRLTRPSLFMNVPTTTEPIDLNYAQFESSRSKCAISTMNSGYFSCGNLLILPQSFGNIYLGEVFSCYMSVHNDSKKTVRNVSVQADLQIGPQKLLLMGQRDSSLIPELKPNCSVDDVIHHEVKEIGTHILACTVSYSSDSEEKLHFRKFFKFQVSKPLDVKTKFFNAESSEVYLEAQLQNITSSSICLEKVSLDASSNFICRQLNKIDFGEGVKEIFGLVSCLNPLDSQQYLFCLTPKPEVYNNIKLLKGITGIGKLDIVWHTNMGEKGRLQTSQLERKAPGFGDIRLNITEIPSIAVLEKSFRVGFHLTNTSERPLNLVLTMNTNFSNGILWQGISGRQFEELEPQASTTFQLHAVPVKSGLLMICGIMLTDTFLKRTHEFNELAKVFVCEEKMYLKKIM